MLGLQRTKLDREGCFCSLALVQPLLCSRRSFPGLTHLKDQVERMEEGSSRKTTPLTWNTVARISISQSGEFVDNHLFASSQQVLEETFLQSLYLTKLSLYIRNSPSFQPSQDKHPQDIIHIFFLPLFFFFLPPEEQFWNHKSLQSFGQPQYT